MVTIQGSGHDTRHDSIADDSRPRAECRHTTAPMRSTQAGFSMVEVVMSVLILAVGLLGMAGTTAWVVRETVMADAVTERMSARQTVIETLRARPFSDVASGTRDVGEFTVTWDVIGTGSNHKSVRVVTTGRGLRRSDAGLAMGPGVSDTLVFHLVEVQ